MNLKKWASRHHTNERWLAKLMEEVGEVAAARSDKFDALDGVFGGNVQRAVNRSDENLMEELSHVEFIAHCWREDLKRDSL